MAAVTKARLEIMLTAMRRVTGLDYGLQWAYGQPRVVENTPNYGAADVSPRMSKRELETWMSAFIKGATTKKKGTQKSRERKAHQRQPAGAIKIPGPRA